MARIRVNELAIELGVESREILKTLYDMGEFVWSASATIEAPVVRRLKEKMAGSPAAPAPKPTPPPKSRPASSGALPERRVAETEASPDPAHGLFGPTPDDGPVAPVLGLQGLVATSSLETPERPRPSATVGRAAAPIPAAPGPRQASRPEGEASLPVAASDIVSSEVLSFVAESPRHADRPTEGAQQEEIDAILTSSDPIGVDLQSRRIAMTNPEAIQARVDGITQILRRVFYEEQRLRPAEVAERVAEIGRRHERQHATVGVVVAKFYGWLGSLENGGDTKQRSEFVKLFENRVSNSGKFSLHLEEQAPPNPTTFYEVWLAETESLIREVQNTASPRFRRGRESLAREFEYRSRKYFNGIDDLKSRIDQEKADDIAALRSTTWRTLCDGIDQAVGQLAQACVRQSQEEPLPPEVMPSWVTGLPALPLPGVPVVSLGRIDLLSFAGTLVEEFPELRDDEEPWDHMIEQGIPAPVSLPLLLDLDEYGGFVTSDVQFLQSAVLDLLTLLPAGRLRVDAFDSEHLGKSVDYLFGLGDTSKKILGDAVWTTPQHIAKVLTQLEEHVTYVTQKYLQGQYKTITEYNAAAGEVSEPYRLLMLHNFPMGFSRDGRYMDEEALQRVQRLARVGRRAGVYVLATAEAPQQTLADLPFIGETLDQRTAELFGCPSVVENEYASGTPELVLTWKAIPWHAPSPIQLGDIHAEIQRMFQAATEVRVDAATVSDLAAKRHEDRVRTGLDVSAVIAQPDDPSTWWQESTQTAAEARFGRSGARGVATLHLDCAASSSALIGGRTGSGKSVLIHSILASLITQYSPEELELYLVDLKEGIEFKSYAAGELPHARVVAIESNREFAMSVMDSLDDEIHRRGEIIRGSGGEHMDLTSYRAGHGAVLPRIVLIIDEFQVLFEKEDALHRRALEVLERIIRQGRAFGVHAVLASQSLTGSASSIRGLVGQIPNRIVLASSESDARMLLSDDNTDSDVSTHPGEGILNTKAGLKEANERFQCAFWTGESRVRLIQAARALADERGFARRPVVFEGYAHVRADVVETVDLLSSDPVREIRLPLGLPMSLAGPVAGRISRGPGGNALIMDGQATAVLSVALPAWMASRIDVRVINFVGDDPTWEDELADLSELGLTLGTPSMLPKVLEAADGLVKFRGESNDYKSPPVALVLVGVQRARQLDPSDYSDTSLLNVLGRILRSGPEVGVHVILTVDKLASLERRLSTADQREFGIRILGPMAESDSHRLIDQPVAGQIRATQLVLDDFDRSITEVVRRYEQISPEWGRLLATTAVAP